MTKFFNSDMEDLAQQLARSPHRLRLGQIDGIEALLGLVEAGHSYPFDFVCYRITKYRKRRETTGYSIPGAALIEDLVAMAEVITRKACLHVDQLNEPYRSQQEVAEELDVSTKTIRRWRHRGLLGIRVVFEDGVNRLAFLRRSIDRFVKQNREMVSKGASFKQLSESERRGIVERARRLVTERPMKLHSAAKLIAAETDRAVETVRYTLRRFEEANPTVALFAERKADAPAERDLAMARCRNAGDPIGDIARAFDCTAKEVDRALRRVQLHQWKQMRWDGVPNELFDAPNADALILDVPEPPEAELTPVKIPGDLPAYLRSLYQTPLLSRELEQDLFRRFNYAKHKVTKLLAAVDPQAIADDPYETLCRETARVESIKQRIIKANLRLVVSIAKKHVGWSPHFFEVISDGNVSLMRALDRFDYALGNRFSTYATWAITKNFARTIPQQHYYGARYMTGNDELLSQAADTSQAEPNVGDEQRVRELISAGLGELTEREREIVSSHFGLGGRGGGVTLEQLGKRFGVTKERVRQIEQKALARLRDVFHPSLADAITG